VLPVDDCRLSEGRASDELDGDRASDELDGDRASDDDWRLRLPSYALSPLLNVRTGFPMCF
jgi:hypothetical protein